MAEAEGLKTQGFESEKCHGEDETKLRRREKTDVEMRMGIVTSLRAVLVARGLSPEKGNVGKTIVF